MKLRRLYCYDCKSWLRTWGLGGANAGIEVQAAVLQDAVVLHPHICVPIQLVQKAQALWVLDSQGREATVVQGNVFPDMVLQGWHQRITWEAILPQQSLLPRASDISTKTEFREAPVLSGPIAKAICTSEKWARQSEPIQWSQRSFPFHVCRYPFSLASILSWGD